MRAAVYARVSTTNHGQDPGVQLREIAEYCSRRGWTVTAEYVDVGISGAKEKRPELDRMLSDAHRRRFDAVIVWKFESLRPFRVAPAPRARNIPSTRHRVCQSHRRRRHVHTCRAHDIHGSGSGGRTRTQPDC